MDGPMRGVELQGWFCLLVAILGVAAFASCSHNQESAIYLVGEHEIAKDQFLRPGAYEVEMAGEYACTAAVSHGPGDGDLSDFVHVFDDDVIDFGDGNGTELRIEARDEVLMIQNDLCKLNRTGD